MRTCSKCGEERDEDAFYVRLNRGKQTPMRQCKSCVAQHNKTYAAKNSARAIKRAKRWAEQNPERHRATQRKAQLKCRAVARVRLREYNKAHPELRRHQEATRRAARLNATPKWADKKRIRQMYALAETLKRATGLEFHVDHIWPLKGKTSCGLHVPNNLRIISKEENLLKSNKEPHYANG